MAHFIQSNGPWNQLVELGNIRINKLKEADTISLSKGLKIEVFTVPHRDEYSETAGYHIKTQNSAYLFIPDIDKWGKWDQGIVNRVAGVDHAFLDATFFKDGEIPNRAMSEIPHPFVQETMALFEQQTDQVKNKIVFIHMNHTNPLLFDQKIQEKVSKEGYRIAEQGKGYE